MTRSLGALEVIDADEVTHALMGPETPLSIDIAREFGSGMLAPDSSVDRQRLGRLVFDSPEALRKLEALVHPAVRQYVDRKLEDTEGEVAAGVVTVEAIRLLDSPLLSRMQGVWFVDSSLSKQFSRLTDLRGYSTEEAKKRIAAQPAFDRSLVTEVIRNDDTLDHLREAVSAAWLRFRDAGA
jgi:dephospho-CoA kinase